MLIPILLLIVLILLNAVFASAEIAVISLNETKLKHMAEEGNRSAKKLVKLTEQPAKFLATIQVAITLAGLLQSAFAAENFATPLAAWLLGKGVPISPAVLKSVIIVLITLVLAYFTLVFGELVPKRLAMKKAEKMALGMSGMLYGVSKVFAPLVWLLTVSTNGVLRLFGINPEEEEEPVTEEEIRLMLSEGEEQGNIETSETELIENVFAFNDISADEICTHRVNTVILRLEEDDASWRQTIMETRHTKYPICKGDADEVLYILDTRDYFRLTDTGRESVLKNATEPPYFVPAGIKANVLFRKMQEKKCFFAVLLDEYGGVAGIVTLHDLTETLLGELKEPEEENAPEVTRNADGTYSVLGTVPLEDVAKELELDFGENESETFGGYITGLIDRVPDDGEAFTCEDAHMVIRVLEVKNHVIGKTEVRLKPQAEQLQCG